MEGLLSTGPTPSSFAYWWSFIGKGLSAACNAGFLFNLSLLNLHQKGYNLVKLRVRQIQHNFEVSEHKSQCEGLTI